MQKLVSTIAGLTLFVSTVIGGTPSSTRAADAENVPGPRWPHTITTNDATIVVYQPQAIAWKEYRTLEVRVAVAVTKQGAQKPVLGALEASVDTHTDFDTRPVIISNRQLRSSRFPSLNTEQAAAMYVGAPRFPPSDPASVQIVRIEPTRPHERLGEIVVDTSTEPAPPIAEVEEKLRTEAGKLGADAVVVVLDRIQPVGAYVSGPWWGRSVDVITGRKVVGMAIRYQR
jgi:hypothetical protein